MRTRRHERTIDLGLRLAGLASCGIAFLAFQALAGMRLPLPPASPGWIAVTFAAIGFLCASVGCALAALGNHIFDEVPISPRWRPSPVSRLDRELAGYGRGGPETQSPVGVVPTQAGSPFVR